MSAPTISILLAVHNGARDLREAIESVIAQTYRDWELLVISNGSTDDTVRIAEELAAADARIRVFVLPDKGKNRAYNHGFSQSRGEYLCFFAADDVLVPTSLERRLAAVQGRGARAFSTCCLQTFSENPTYHGVVFPKRITLPNYSGGSIFFSRDLAAMLFPIPVSQPNEDTWTSLHLRAFGENVHVPEPLYLYRIHEGNSYGYGTPFDAKREQYLRRMHAYQLFFDKYRAANVPFVDDEVRPFLQGLAAARQRDVVGVLRARGLRLGTKLVLIMYCSEMLYHLRHTFFRTLSGGTVK